MEVSFDDNKYDRLETDRNYDAGFPKAVISAYRKNLRFLRAARDICDVMAMRSLTQAAETGEPTKAFYLPLSEGYVLEIGLGARSLQSAFCVRGIHSTQEQRPRGLA
jgi:plasmid maintenance system killer protein